MQHYVRIQTDDGSILAHKKDLEQMIIDENANNNSRSIVSPKQVFRGDGT